MGPGKMKSLPGVKLRYCFPKNRKSHFCPPFWLFIYSTILLKDLCKKMNWPQGDFCSGNICIALSFQIKNQIPKILPMWVFVPLKFQQNFEILQLVQILTQMSLTYDFHQSNSIPSIFYWINHFHIHLIVI